MLNIILEMVHYGTILVFGIYLSAAFLGVCMNRRNITILLCFSALCGLANIIFFTWFDTRFTEQIYPIIVHLPLILFLVLFYKFRVVSSAIAVFTAYLCCQLSNWLGLFFLNFAKLTWVYYTVRIASTIIVFVLLMYFVAPAVVQLFMKPAKDVIILGMMPLIYYLYDYSVTVYTMVLYAGIEVITEFLGFMLCIFYILFLLIYFKQYEEKMETEQRNRMMEMQRVQSEKEVEMMKRSERNAAIMRHDMRHYLSDIEGFIKNGEYERARTYIQEIIIKSEKTAIKKYCSNKIVNMILSSYESIIKEKEIAFHYSIRIPSEFQFSDSDISSILSNGLENAINAVSFLEQDRREIELDMRINNDKLLISIKNTYLIKPKLVDGMPKAREVGHGFGTQSIYYVTERLKGKCQFTVEDDYFILRIVL